MRAPAASANAAPGVGDPPRDQRESAFAAILRTLVERTPGARAAALVDFEGETVDYAGSEDPYALRLAGAHWRIVLDEARAQPNHGDATWIAARASLASFVVRGLPDGYALVVVYERRVGLPDVFRRAFDQCADDLGREAGWPRARATWLAVDVAVGSGHRPAVIRGATGADAVEVIGIVSQGLGRRERGWRVRTASGVETTLIREPGGFWYADEAAAISPSDLGRLRPPNKKPKQTL